MEADQLRDELNGMGVEVRTVLSCQLNTGLRTKKSMPYYWTQNFFQMNASFQIKHVLPYFHDP